MSPRKITDNIDVKELKSAIKNAIISQLMPGIEEDRCLIRRATNAGMQDAMMNDFEAHHKDKMVSILILPIVSVHSNLTT